MLAWKTTFLYFASNFITTLSRTPPAIPPLVEGDDLLLWMPESPHECYYQYGPVDEKIEMIKPSLLSAITQDACICEYWWRNILWPYAPKYYQLFFYEGTGDDHDDWATKHSIQGHHCLKPTTANILGCSDFGDDHECVAHLRLGTTLDVTENMTDTAMLKCTDGSSLTPSDTPKYPVMVYEVDKYNIGARCHAEAIKTMLNGRLEQSRNNNQFFWQIPIFGTEDFKYFCDSRKLKEGTSIKIYFKCVEVLSSLPVVIEKPSSRGAVSEATSPPKGFECYKLAGPPHEPYLLQGFDINPDNPEFPTAIKPLCVCEENTVLKVQDQATVCEVYERQTCIPEPQREDPFNQDQCTIEVPLFEDKKDIIWCKDEIAPEQEEVGVDCKACKGTKYNPLLEPVIKEVYLAHGQYKRHKDFIVNLWCARHGKYNGASIRSMWKDWINERYVHRPYTDINYQKLLDRKYFLTTYCPKLMDPMNRGHALSTKGCELTGEGCQEYQLNTAEDGWYIKLDIICSAVDPL